MTECGLYLVGWWASAQYPWVGLFTMSVPSPGWERLNRQCRAGLAFAAEAAAATALTEETGGEVYVYKTRGPSCATHS